MKWGIVVMKSKTSLINRGILINDFKRFSWIGAGYLLILLLTVPLKVFMIHSRAEELIINDASVYLRIFQFSTNEAPLMVMSLIIVPVLTGLLLFRYLQDSQAADMLHALPVKRETLYNTHVLSGITFLFVPLILTALATWALVAGVGIDVKGAHILTWLAVSLLMNLLFFICSVAVGMVTGITIVQGVLSYILLLLPSGLSMLLVYNLSKYVYGFPYDFYYDKITHLSPLIKLTEISGQPIGAVESAAYLASAVALYFLGSYLYRKRRLETAGNTITFDALQPVFKYGVTFCFMLLLGSSFYSAQGTMGWAYFGYFLGSLLSYFLAEILLNKSLQVFQLKRFKGYGIYCLAMLILFGMLHIDFAGYEKRLPDLENVKSVYFDHSFYALKEKDNMRTFIAQDGTEYTYELFVPAIFTETDDINNIYALHRQIIANQLDGKEALLSAPYQNDYRSIALAYELNNGDYIYRQYNIAVADYAELLKPIYESREYKKLNNEILRLNVADIKMLEISTNGMKNKNLRIIDPELIAQAVSALQSDIYEETYEEMTDANRRPSWANIHISLNNGRDVSLNWEKSYGHFEQWLKDTGEYNQARIIPGEDIAFAIVDKYKEILDNAPQAGEYAVRIVKAGTGLNTQHPASQTTSQDIPATEEVPGMLKITDPEELELCLRNYRYSRVDNAEQAAYSIIFQLNDGSAFSGLLFEADTPDFIKKHFAG
jgi:ABC-2 type transport system permease protein